MALLAASCEQPQVTGVWRAAAAHLRRSASGRVFSREPRQSATKIICPHRHDGRPNPFSVVIPFVKLDMCQNIRMAKQKNLYYEYVHHFLEFSLPEPHLSCTRDNSNAKKSQIVTSQTRASDAGE